MKPRSTSESVLIEEVMQISHTLKMTLRGLSIGALIRMIRIQLGMSQRVLAKRAKLPQSTISLIEKGQRNASLSTLNKVLKAMFCDIIIAPLLHDSIENIRRARARKVVEKHLDYLKGTMNLENQQPDSRFVEELIKQEVEKLLRGPNAKLWEE
jgi:transcriptional regulator with XRE-family HTH domain